MSRRFLYLFTIQFGGCHPSLVQISKSPKAGHPPALVFRPGRCLGAAPGRLLGGRRGGTPSGGLRGPNRAPRRGPTRTPQKRGQRGQCWGGFMVIYVDLWWFMVIYVFFVICDGLGGFSWFWLILVDFCGLCGFMVKFFYVDVYGNVWWYISVFVSRISWWY